MSQPALIDGLEPWKYEARKLGDLKLDKGNLVNETDNFQVGTHVPAQAAAEAILELKSKLIAACGKIMAGEGGSAKILAKEVMDELQAL